MTIRFAPGNVADRGGARLAVVLAGSALALIGLGLWLGIPAARGAHPLHPPGPLSPFAGSPAGTPPTGPGSTSTSPSTATAGVPASGSVAALSASQSSAPANIAIPSLGVTSQLGPARGLNPDGTINDAPLTGPIWALPWWYSGGASPGQQGSAVILGHVDSALGQGQLGVFYRLGDLQPGAAITVTLQDGIVTSWVAVSNSLYKDTAFPDSVVYNPDGPPMLRLVTCGGTFNGSTHEYDGAVVVTARLTGVAGA